MASHNIGDEGMSISLGIKMALISTAVCMGYIGIVHYDIRSHANEPAHAAQSERTSRLEATQSAIKEDVGELKGDVKDVKKNQSELQRGVNEILHELKK
jgi:peptidoglycan hydrolase CwlO-like protein